jgi:hypothetical protein
MTIQEIAQIVKEKAELFKKQYGNKALRSERDKLPEFTPIYRDTVEMYERIRVHSQADVFPERLFYEKAPNQVAAEWEYQKRVFKAIGSITHPYWDKALGVVNRIWNEKNYTIKLPEIESPVYSNYPVDKYFNEEYPEYGSIEAYFKSVVTRKKIEDPNAWIVIDVKPLVSDTEPVKPYAQIWGSKCVIDYKEDSHLMVKTYEHSWVKYGNRLVKEGIVLRFYDQTGIYRIEQTGVKVDWVFSAPVLEYAWNLDRLPGWRLKGKPVDDDGNLIYQSYFYAAIPALNTAIIDFSTAQLSKIINVFAERWEYADDCDAEGCENGRIWDDERHNHRMCSSCSGTGRKNLSSPTNVIQIAIPKPSNPLEGDTSKLATPPAGYISKENATEQIRLLIEEQETNITRAFAMINIDVSNSLAHGTDTALGKQIDREELFSFILQISNECFELMGNVINAIGFIRYSLATWENVGIGYPQNFAIRNDEALTFEISEAKKAGIPDVAIQALLKQYAGTRFNSQADVERIFDLTFKADRVLSMDANEIQAQVSTGLLSKEAAILHSSINFFIEKGEREHEDFWEKEDQERIDILNAYALEEATNLAKPKLSPQEIIEQINAKKADAANELRGTVGGIQAILGIITQVGLGVYEPEAAMELLQTTYQFTEEEARAIIGNPTAPPAA